MSRHRASRQSSRHEHDTPQHLPLVALAANVRPRNVDPEAAAKIRHVSGILQPREVSAVLDHPRLTLTFELHCAFAERLSGCSIREDKTFEAILIEILKAGAP